MATELEKIMSRMKVTLKVTEIAGTPARGFTPAIRNWRAILTRELKGDEKPLKLTLTIVSQVKPTVDSVIRSIRDDIEDGAMTLWEFAQAYGIKGKTDNAVESMFKTCKRVSARAKKFCGDSKSMRELFDFTD